MTQKTNPFISVIVTTYNRKNLLKETIDSILNQTYDNFELIVVDNYSNYNFLKYITSFDDDRIKAFQNKNNGNIALNRNFGIKKAIGEYIAFCDDDDLWFPKKLEIQLNHFTDKIIGMGTEIVLIDKDSVIIQDRSKPKDSTLYFNNLIKFKSIPLSSLIVRSNGLLFDENKSFIAVEDFDFQLNLAKYSKKPILKLGEAMVYYRINTQNRNSGIQQKKNSLYVIKKYEKYLTPKMRRNIYQLIYFRVGKMLLQDYQFKEAKKYFLFSLSNIYWKNSRISKSLFGIFICFLPQFLQNKVLKKITRN
jgi:glycosyltransferase involved in cell wall biosynthesis